MNDYGIEFKKYWRVCIKPTFVVKLYNKVFCQCLIKLLRLQQQLVLTLKIEHATYPTDKIIKYIVFIRKKAILYNLILCLQSTFYIYSNESSYFSLQILNIIFFDLLLKLISYIVSCFAVSKPTSVVASRLRPLCKRSNLFETLDVSLRWIISPLFSSSCVFIFRIFLIFRELLSVPSLLAQDVY